MSYRAAQSREHGAREGGDTDTMKREVPPLRSIEEELAACRAAFADLPNPTHVYCQWHNKRISAVTSSEIPEERILFIGAHKLEIQRAVRFRNFRPVKSPLPQELVAAEATCQSAWNVLIQKRNAFEAACFDASKSSLERGNYYSEHLQATRDLDFARDELRRILAEMSDTIALLHDADWPDNTWNGLDIFV
jgi:hypothetical protein